MVEGNDRPNQRNGGTRPVPDPTILTTEALQREISALSQLIDAKIAGNTKARDEEVKRLNQQLQLVERQRVEQKKDTKDAVDAALAAQKEAVREQTIASERSISKSETATNKQLEQLASTFASEAASLRRSMDELKERITDVDRKASSVVQQKIGAKEDRSGLYAGLAAISAILVLGLTALGILIALGN